MDRLWSPWRYAYISADEKAGARAGVPEALAAWPGDHHCLFCNVLGALDYAVAQGMAAVDAERQVFVLERGPLTFTMLNAFPYNGGHLMVVPYEHAESLAGLPAPTAAALMTGARRAERALRSVYKPHGLNLGLNLGEAAGAGVAHHLHLHAVPRWSGDTNFMTVVAETRVLPEMLADAWTRLRAALAADTTEPLG